MCAAVDSMMEKRWAKNTRKYINDSSDGFIKILLSHRATLLVNFSLTGPVCLHGRLHQMNVLAIMQENCHMVQCVRSSLKRAAACYRLHCKSLGRRWLVPFFIASACKKKILQVQN